MNDSERNIVLTIVGLIGFIGGPLGVYVAMKVAIAELKTHVMVLVDEVRGMRAKSEKNDAEVAALRTEQAKAQVEIVQLKSRVEVLERRQSQPRYPALRREEEG